MLHYHNARHVVLRWGLVDDQCMKSSWGLSSPFIYYFITVFYHQVEAVDEALYNCNWPDGPIRDRKMLTFYKIRFFKPVQVMGGPFFIARWEAMADVSKKEGAFGYRNYNEVFYWFRWQRRRTFS